MYLGQFQLARHVIAWNMIPQNLVSGHPWNRLPSTASKDLFGRMEEYASILERYEGNLLFHLGLGPEAREQLQGKENGGFASYLFSQPLSWIQEEGLRTYSIPERVAEDMDQVRENIRGLKAAARSARERLQAGPGREGELEDALSETMTWARQLRGVFAVRAAAARLSMNYLSSDIRAGVFFFYSTQVRSDLALATLRTDPPPAS